VSKRKSKSKKRKYIPSILVESDDITVTDEDGNEHHPHEGEWVRFRRGVPLSVIRKMSKAALLEELWREGSAESIAQMDDILGDVIEALHRQILDWSWTDTGWQPLPKPRADKAVFREALGNLEDFEMAWLQEHFADGAEVPKN
jgi:hypothetical protein